MSTVEFFGETLELSDSISEFALGEFAEAAADGEDGDSMQGMASLSRFVRECIAEKDHAKYRAIARKNKAGFADITKIIQAAFEQATERPTGRPADSSGGPVSIDPKSESNSDDRALARFDGRPDLKLAILRTRAAS